MQTITKTLQTLQALQTTIGKGDDELTSTIQKLVWEGGSIEDDECITNIYEEVIFDRVESIAKLDSTNIEAQNTEQVMLIVQALLNTATNLLEGL